MSEEENQPKADQPGAGKEETKEAKPEEKKEETKPLAEAPDEPSAEDDSAESSAESADVEVPKKFKKIVEEIESMSVMDLNELVKLFEKKFGVSAAATAVAGPAAGGEAEEEKDSFTVELKTIGDSKIGVIKAVKAALGLGLKEAKDLVDGAPSVLKEGANKVEAEEMKKTIEEAGGTVELK